MSVAALAHQAHAAVIAFPAAVGDPVAYSPAQMATDLAAGALTVLPWVGAAIGAAMLLVFTFLGINKGFGFFWKLVKKN